MEVQENNKDIFSIEYPKIECLFKRDINGNKKIIEGEYQNETLKYLSDSLWDMTEKIDGTNIRIIWDGHSVSFLGRTNNAIIPFPLQAKLEELMGGNINEELFEQNFGELPVILFGEGYGNKIQKNGYKYIKEDVSFILFDVFINGHFQSREDVENIANIFNLDVVPVVFRGMLLSGVQFVKTHPLSNIGIAEMEGLVARPHIELQSRIGKRIICKIKVCDFQ